MYILYFFFFQIMPAPIHLPPLWIYGFGPTQIFPLKVSLRPGNKLGNLEPVLFRNSAQSPTDLCRVQSIYARAKNQADDYEGRNSEAGNRAQISSRTGTLTLTPDGRQNLLLFRRIAFAVDEK